jgi:hypothetical protein
MIAVASGTAQCISILRGSWCEERRIVAQAGILTWGRPSGPLAVSSDSRDCGRQTAEETCTGRWCPAGLCMLHCVQTASTTLHEMLTGCTAPRLILQSFANKLRTRIDPCTPRQSLHRQAPPILARLATPLYPCKAEREMICLSYIPSNMTTSFFCSSCRVDPS